MILLSQTFLSSPLKLFARICLCLHLNSCTQQTGALVCQKVRAPPLKSASSSVAHHIHADAGQGRTKVHIQTLADTKNATGLSLARTNNGRILIAVASLEMGPLGGSKLIHFIWLPSVMAAVQFGQTGSSICNRKKDMSIELDRFCADRQINCQSKPVCSPLDQSMRTMRAN